MKEKADVYITDALIRYNERNKQGGTTTRCFVGWGGTRALEHTQSDEDLPGHGTDERFRLGGDRRGLRGGDLNWDWDGVDGNVAARSGGVDLEVRHFDYCDARSSISKLFADVHNETQLTLKKNDEKGSRITGRGCRERQRGGRRESWTAVGTWRVSEG